MRAAYEWKRVCPTGNEEVGTEGCWFDKRVGVCTIFDFDFVGEIVGG